MAEEPTFLQKQLEGVQAKIQAEVGTFLQLKNRIQPFRLSSDPIVAKEAERLYQQQVGLEAQLEKTMGLINTLKEEGISGLLVNATEIYKAYDFVNDMKDHKDQVQQFEAVNQGKAGSYAGAGMLGSGSAWVTVAGIVGAIGYYLYKGKR